MKWTYRARFVGIPDTFPPVHSAFGNSDTATPPPPFRRSVPTAWSTELLEDRSLLSSTSLGSEAASGVTAQEVSSLDGGVSITGPALLKDINTLPASSFPGIHDADRGEDTFAVLNGIAYFFANDGVHGRELWRTDGTAAGTFFAADINPGSDGSSFDGYYDGSYVAHDQLVVAKDMLFLNAFDGIHGGELWTSDGTPAGTYLSYQDRNVLFRPR